MPYYPFGNGTIVTPEWLNDIQTRVYNPDTGEYRQWQDSDLSDSAGQIKDRLDKYINQLKVTGNIGLYVSYNAGAIRDINSSYIPVAAGQVLCADNTTTYICIDSTGNVFGNATATKTPLAKVIFSQGQLVTNDDLRSTWLVFDKQDLGTSVALVSTDYRAKANDFCIVNQAGVSITMPVSPSDGDMVYFFLNDNVLSTALISAVDIQGITNNTLQNNRIYYALYANSNWHIGLIPIGNVLSTTNLIDMPSDISSQSGKILRVNSTGTRYELTTNILPSFTVTTTNYSASPNERIFIKNSNATTLTLPANPSEGNFVECTGDFATNNVTINRNGNNINGQVATLGLTTNSNHTRLIFSSGNWWSNGGTTNAEGTTGTTGTLGTTNSVFTSTLIADATMGTGSTINSSTGLCLLAYSTTTKFILQPALPSGADVFTFYKSTEFTEVAKDVSVTRVSDTLALVTYYIPSSNTIVTRLVQVTTIGIVLLAQANILGGYRDTPYSLNTRNKTNMVEPCFVCFYENNIYGVSTNNVIKLYTVGATTLTESCSVSLPNLPNTVMPTQTALTIVTNGIYWYFTHKSEGRFSSPNIGYYNTSFTGLLTIINSSTNLVVYQSGNDSINYLFKDATSQSVKIFLETDLVYYWFTTAQVTSLVFASKIGVLTNSSPFYSITSTISNSSLLGYGLSTPPSANPWISRIGNKILINLGTKYVIGTQNATDGSITLSGQNNLLGLASPSATYSYFGNISSTKACIVTNGFVAIAYV